MNNRDEHGLANYLPGVGDNFELARQRQEPNPSRTYFWRTKEGANPRTSLRRRALRHDYNLRSWKTEPEEVKTETLVELGFQVTHTVLLSRYLSRSSVRSLNCCARAFDSERVSECFASLFQVRTVADTDRLAQASLTRPGEMCRGSPRAFCASGRSGDQGGRGLVWARLSRLSETPQPERGAGRGSAVIEYLFVLEWSVLVGYECMMSDMYIMEYELGFQVTHTVLLSRYLSRSSVRSLNCCARAFDSERVSECFASLFQVRTVADTDRLAQASLTRPGEMCRGSPRAFCASGRSGDQGGRGLVWARLSRLSETPQPERGAGRGSAVIEYLFVLEWSVLVGVEQRYPPQVQASAESD
ncbi:hypothetical protein DEO72_LG9g2533 [Vigna unguiculata]|uniref:Uncharacterized protein n=1 Tax=Vigna unguiculata TaxID=3917 RepID=A0A4D6N134_VIGUN|nr:hypothetical protein DEO72_LG9g2533 [Vigna unguiculata]